MSSEQGPLTIIQMPYFQIIFQSEALVSLVCYNSPAGSRSTGLKRTHACCHHVKHTGTGGNSQATAIDWIGHIRMHVRVE